MSVKFLHNKLCGFKKKWVSVKFGQKAILVQWQVEKIQSHGGFLLSWLKYNLEY